MPDHHDTSTIAALRQRIAKLQRERQDERADEKTNTRRLNARVQELIGEKERLQEDLLVAQQDLENANYAVAQSSDELRELREANKTFNGMCAENNRLTEQLKLARKGRQDASTEWRKTCDELRGLRAELQACKDAKPKVALMPGIPEEAFQAAEAHGRLLGFKQGCEFMKSMVVLP